MRRKALDAEIVIVNHHLFFADIAVKREAAGAPDAGILPEAAAVVFDEAHELEDVASSYFGLSVSNIRFEELARDTDTLLRGKEGGDHLPALNQQLRDRARMFFAGLPIAGDGRQPFIGREEFLETSGDLYMAVRATLMRLESEMDGMKTVDEAPGLRKRVTRLRSELEFLLESSNSNMVYWMERRVAMGAASGHRSGARGGLRTTFLQATPIDVSELVSELVFEQIPTVILTSATLTVQGGFEHIRKRLGLVCIRLRHLPFERDFRGAIPLNVLQLDGNGRVIRKPAGDADLSHPACFAGARRPGVDDCFTPDHKAESAATLDYKIVISPERCEHLTAPAGGYPFFGNAAWQAIV